MADLLQVEIERGVDAQAGLVHFIGAEVLVELAPHFFLEPRSHGSHGLRDVEAERSVARRFGLGVGDNAVGLHFTEHEIAAAQCAFGIEDGRKSNGTLGQSGEKRGLSQLEIFGVLRKKYSDAASKPYMPLPR